MFVSHDDWPPPPSWEPPRPPPRWVGAREERVILWLVGVNLLLLFAAPIAGASVVQVIWALVD